MNHVVEESIQLNQHIKQSEQYKRYILAKENLLKNDELARALKEFKRRNYELQVQDGINPFDEVNLLMLEYDELLHNKLVSEYLISEQQICTIMKEVYCKMTDGLEFDY